MLQDRARIDRTAFVLYGAFEYGTRAAIGMPTALMLQGLYTYWFFATIVSLVALHRLSSAWRLYPCMLCCASWRQPLSNQTRCGSLAANSSLLPGRARGFATGFVYRLVFACFGCGMCCNRSRTRSIAAPMCAAHADSGHAQFDRDADRPRLFPIGYRACRMCSFAAGRVPAASQPLLAS